MKKKVRVVLIVLLALVFVVSATWAIMLILRNRREAALYSDAQQSYVLITERSPADAELEASAPTEDSEKGKPSNDIPDSAEEMSETFSIQVDFPALQQAGKDVKAWLYVPGTNISYPVVQGTDNKAYERHDYTGAYAWAGSIFLDYRSAADFSGRSTVIYGHNIKNGTMFSQLNQYRDRAFLTANPNFFVVTPEGQLEYEIVAVLVTDALGPVYTFSFADDAAFSQYLESIQQDTLLEAGTAPALEDRLVLLSTCTNRQRTERLVVVGRMVDEKESRI